jgi:hypothetical protein
MGVLLAWFIVAGVQTVRDVRYQGRAPIPAEYVASGMLYGALAVLSSVNQRLATALAWGFLFAVTLEAGGPRELVSGGFPRPLARYFSPGVSATHVLGGGAGSQALGGAGSVAATSGCRPPIGLVSVGGVTLVAPAMAAFKAAQGFARARGFRIEVTSSYRNCSQQEQACVHNCGNPNGCPPGVAGTPCATPGTSLHQAGRAIDVANSDQAAGVLAAAGWCRGIRIGDPAHFSWPTCG